jgi:peroxiredoxin
MSADLRPRTGPTGRVWRALRCHASTLLAVLAVVSVIAGARWSAEMRAGTDDPPLTARSADVVVAGEPRSRPLEPGEAVPGFRAPEVRGGTVHWPDHDGRAVTLVVWAPWCPGCREELAALAQRPGSHQTVVGIVTGGGERLGSSALSVLERVDARFPTAVDDADGSIAAALGVDRVPLTYEITPKGVVSSIRVGHAAGSASPGGGCEGLGSSVQVACDD